MKKASQIGFYTNHHKSRATGTANQSSFLATHHSCHVRFSSRPEVRIIFDENITLQPLTQATVLEFSGSSQVFLQSWLGRRGLYTLALLSRACHLSFLLKRAGFLT